MMTVRLARLKKNGPSGLRWSILPPQFRTDLTCNGTKIAAKYANGTDELFPPFWEIDYLYIPLYVSNLEDWVLVRIDMRTMEMLQYWSNNRYTKDYRRLLFLPVIDPMPICFEWLLDEIKYWQRFEGPYLEPKHRHIKLAFTDDYLPKDGGDLGGDSGVLVCMLIQKLVERKPVSMEGNFKDTCKAYRLFMAEQLYRARTG
jgi:hypothetical protein